MLSIEHERDDIISYLMDTYKFIDLEKTDTKDGNTTLHLACLKLSLMTVRKIFE
jgi:hypothetical protein